MYGFIYLTTNLINYKKYIGMCKYTHENNYLGSGKLLKEAIKKYGKINFERKILQSCDTFQELSEAEIYWIKMYDAVNSAEFYNLSYGGFGGNSESMKDFWSTLNKDERKFCRNWSKRDMSGENNPMFGKKHLSETKIKIGKKSVNRNWNKPNHLGSNNPKSKAVFVETETEKKHFACLKDFYYEKRTVPYATLKSIAQKGSFSKKHKIKITYV